MDLTDWVMEGVGDALEAVGAEMAESIRQSISIACPPHSAPGEAPHLETGQLAGTVGYDVTTTGPSEMTLSVGAGPAIAPEGEPFDYAPHLEVGMDRPYVLVRLEELADLFIERYTND